MFNQTMVYKAQDSITYLHIHNNESNLFILAVDHVRRRVRLATEYLLLIFYITSYPTALHN